MSTAADRERDTYPPIPGPPNEPPEPVYEYRVVCAGPWGPRPFGWPRGSYDGAVRVVKSLETTHHASHDHTVERRAVGPWEAT